MRASRLLSILLLLQTRGRVTAAELAGELEVSVRTIYRDMESLQLAGVPMYADAGRSGGYQLLDGYRTRLTGLTSAEAASVFLAGFPGLAEDLGLGTAVATASLKLLAALPAESRHRAGLIRDRFHLDASAWYRDADQPPHLAAVAEAVWEQRRIAVRYRRWADPSEVDRVLEPYGVVLKAGHWYLVARGRQRVGVYRVSQIRRLDVLAECFARPDGFDLAAHWAAHLADFDARRYRDVAVVRLSPRGRDLVSVVLDAPVARAAAETAEPPDAHGWVRARLPIESVDHAHDEFLKLGTDIEVLAPDALRARMAATATALAATYHRPAG